MKEHNIQYLDYLRVVCIIAVVLIHVTTPALSSINNPGWEINLAINAMSRFGVPIFFMISGSLFLNPERNVSFPYIKKKLGRIILAFIVFSFAYNILWYIGTVGFTFDYNVFTHKFIPNLIGGWYHLWYLQALMVLYILTPQFRLFVNDTRIARYSICILFLICSLIPIINNFFQLQSYTQSMFDNMAFDLPKYSLYFILGCYASSSKINFSSKSVISIGVLALLLMIVLDIYRAAKTGVVEAYFSSYLSPFTVVYTTCLFLLFKNCFKNAVTPKIIFVLSSYSFGIYLVHDFFLILLRECNLFSLSSSAIVNIFLVLLFVLTGSVITTFILKMLPGFKKFI